jgi:hypothetical protein
MNARDSRANRLVAAGLMAGSTVVVLLRLPFGCDLAHGAGDEGFFLASAARYLLGDRPFFDERHTTPIAFDLFDLVLFRLLPVDSLLVWRATGLVLSAFALGFLSYSIRPWLGELRAAALYSACILFAPLNLWTPNYKNLSLLFLCVAMGAVAVAIRRTGPGSRYLLVAFSALSFCLACVCYSTLLVTVVVVAAYALHLWLRGTGASASRRDLVAVWLLLVVTLLGLGITGLVYAGVAGQALQNIVEMSAYREQYSEPLLSRVIRKLLGHALWTELAALAPLAIGGGLAVCSTDRRVVRLGATVLFLELFALALLFVLTAGLQGSLAYEYASLSPWLFLTNVCLVLAVLAASARACGWKGMFGSESTWLLGYGLAVGGVVVLSASMASSYIAELNVCSWVIWPPLVLRLARTIDEGHRRSPPSWTLPAMLGVLGLTSVLHLWTWTFGDEAPWKLHRTFAKGKLAGIVTSTARVDDLEALETTVRQHARRGDFVLSYGGFWGLSWLTDTRPALYSTIVAPAMPVDPLLGEWLKSMAAEGRTPEVIVTRIPLRGRNSLELFVVERFDRVQLRGPFEVWLPKQSKGTSSWNHRSWE